MSRFSFKADTLTSCPVFPLVFPVAVGRRIHFPAKVDKGKGRRESNPATGTAYLLGPAGAARLVLVATHERLWLGGDGGGVFAGFGRNRECGEKKWEEASRWRWIIFSWFAWPHRLRAAGPEKLGQPKHDA